MNDLALKIEGLSKQYRIGEVTTGNLSHDINRWWYKIRGMEDPYLKVGDVNDRTIKGKGDYVWALRNIDFELKKGEILGIIGRNGAGKSTLLKILSRTTTPTIGLVKFKGRLSSLLEVGTGFHPELSGRENIFLNGAILGMKKLEIRKKFDEIVEFSGVERYIDTPVKRYSSGMYVRLAFAVAAYLESEILIVDEVLAVGDFEFQKKCLGKMSEISKGEGRTVLFVSHNLAAIESMCTKSLLLNQGSIQAIGETHLVTHEYLNSPISLNSKFGSYPTRILNVQLNNGNPIKATDKLELQIEIECKQVIFNPHVQITISSNGQTIADTATLLTGYQPDSFKLGINGINCVFYPSVLLPERSYFIRIAMRENDGKKAIIESQEIFKFEVMSSEIRLIVENRYLDQINDIPIPLTPYEITFNGCKTFNWNKQSLK